MLGLMSASQVQPKADVHRQQAAGPRRATQAQTAPDKPRRLTSHAGFQLRLSELVAKDPYLQADRQRDVSQATIKTVSEGQCKQADKLQALAEVHSAGRRLQAARPRDMRHCPALPQATAE